MSRIPVRAHASVACQAWAVVVLIFLTVAAVNCSQTNLEEKPDMHSFLPRQIQAWTRVDTALKYDRETIFDYIFADTRFNLGTSDPVKIDVVRLGWETDALI